MPLAGRIMNGHCPRDLPCSRSPPGPRRLASGSHRLPSRNSSYRFNVSRKVLQLRDFAASEPAANDTAHDAADAPGAATEGGGERSRSPHNSHPERGARLAISRQNGHIPVMQPGPPIIVGISGASGAIYGVRLLEALHEKKIPAHLIISKSAALTLKRRDRRLDRSRACARADHVSKYGYRCGDFVRIIPHPRHGDRAVLDPNAIRYCLRHD